MGKLLRKKSKNLLFLMVVIVASLLVGCGDADIHYDSDKDTELTGSSTSEKDTENSGSNSTEKDTENIEDIQGGQDTDTEDIDDTETDTVVLPEYTYENISQTMYTTESINVRNLPTIDGNKIGGLLSGKEVQVTGRCKETGWYRIEYNGGIGYVSADYITDKLPSSWVAQLDVAQGASQIIVVTAEKMGTIDVTVSMHTKDENGIWVENYSTPGQIGRNGLGKEKEGDGKTPIGIFTFTKAFGILPNPGITSMPYLQVDETHHWVDDPESKYYNQCVSTRDVEPDWNSTEHLYKYVGDYNYSLATSYNKECTPYVGCAIFLHCTVKDFRPTSGCIAIPEEYMAQTMINLRNDCIIVIDTVENIYSY